MNDRLRIAIREACGAIRELPDTDAPLQHMYARGIERGKYDATLPIRERLVALLDFLVPFDREETVLCSKEIPQPLIDSIINELRSVKQIAVDIPAKCQRQTTSVVPPSFHGAESATAHAVEKIHSRIFPQLSALRDSSPPTISEEGGSRPPLNEGVEVNVFGASSGVDRSSRRVVITLHGIRTRGKWQKDLDECLADANFIPKSLDYGWFGVLPFLFQRQREKQVRQFVEDYDSITKKYPDNAPSVIAHSFGTYIVAKALSAYAGLIKFDRVIFCGAIVPVDFPWSAVAKEGLVKRVLNDYGHLDAWAGNVGLALPDAGPSGREEFSDTANGLVIQSCHPEWGHSHYFFELNYKERWIKFLRGEELRDISLEPHWHFPLVWIMPIVLLLLVAIFVGWSVFQRSHATHSQTPNPTPMMVETATPAPSSNTLQQDILTLEVDAESRGASGNVSRTRHVDIPAGWTYLRKEEKAHPGKPGSNGDGTYKTRLLYGPDRNIIGVEATAIAYPNYGGKTNYYKVVVFVHVERRGN